MYHFGFLILELYKLQSLDIDNFMNESFFFQELLSITDETGDERTGLSEEVIDENLIRRK